MLSKINMEIHRLLAILRVIPAWDEFIIFDDNRRTYYRFKYARPEPKLRLMQVLDGYNRHIEENRLQGVDLRAGTSRDVLWSRFINSIMIEPRKVIKTRKQLDRGWAHLHKKFNKQESKLWITYKVMKFNLMRILKLQ